MSNKDNDLIKKKSTSIINKEYNNSNNNQPIANTDIVTNISSSLTREVLMHNIRNKRYKKVVFITGAGISVAAGIPDFRSPKVGLYAQLKTFGLPHPEEIFSLEYLQESPQPFYAVANRYLRFKAKPVYAHYFIKRFADDNMLYMDYTQNIDGLELDVGIPSKYLVQAHGHMRSAHCINPKCKTEANMRSFQRFLKKEEVMYCQDCKSGIVKPDIVFFGEKLPTIFRTKFNAINKADLVFVMGTSLKVKPFSILLNTLPSTTPLVVINHHNPCIVRENFLFLCGDIEDTIIHLMRDLGWIEPSTDISSSSAIEVINSCMDDNTDIIPIKKDTDGAKKIKRSRKKDENNPKKKLCKNK